MNRRTLALVFVLALVVPALLPPSSTYDPAPLLASLSASVAPVTPGPIRRPGSVFVTNVRLPGSPAATSLRIEDGRITAIGSADGGSLPILDGGGRYAIPGLFDSHVHLTMAPGAALRGDDASTTADLRAQHMRAYLACGVTSVFDTAGDDRIAMDVRARVEAGHPGPRYFALGPAVTARDGYVADLFPPGFSETDADQVAGHLDRLVAMKADGVKVPLEPGMLAPIWNVHGAGMLDAIRTGAAERNLPIYVHAISQKMYELGLGLSPHAFVHPPETIEPATLQRLVDSKAWVMTTLAIYDVQRDLLKPDVFNDEQATLVIPPIEMETLRSPDMQRRYMVSMVGENAPFVPGRYRDLLGWIGLTSFGQASVDSELEARLGRTKGTLLQMHRAGVPLVLGSDAGNWPVFPFFFHGPTTWREIALLEEMGLTPRETLDASTIQAARMLGVDSELGSIEVGKRADVLLLDRDPLDGLAKAMPSLHTVIADGVAKTKEEWMK
jgi:cytosine/adenosine deaminase-related metal-dependent hydrolase